MTIDRNTLGSITESEYISAYCPVCMTHREPDLTEAKKKFPHMTIKQMKERLECNVCKSKDIAISRIFRTKGSIPHDYNVVLKSPNPKKQC